MVSTMIRRAGFERTGFERHDRDMCIGKDIDDAVAFPKAPGPAGEIIRLAGAEGERHQHEVDAALAEVLKQFERDDGIRAPSSAWIITATNPACMGECLCLIAPVKFALCSSVQDVDPHFGRLSRVSCWPRRLRAPRRTCWRTVISMPI